MERELTLATLSLSACGSALLLSSSLLPSAQSGGGGQELEHACARRMWSPLVFALLVFAGLLGWGLQEPDMTNEALSPVVWGVALVVSAIWGRAALRAVLSVAAATSRPATGACTIGLLRPRVVVVESLASLLDESELGAVLEHERAHVRHRDPLRILLTQFVADLQWPVPSAGTLLSAWRHALELARDEEARARGVDGADLASAIVKAARFAVGRRATAAALVDAPQLADRVARLLQPVPTSRGPWTFRRLSVVLASSLAVAVIVGHIFGEQIVRAVAGVD